MQRFLNKIRWGIINNAKIILVVVAAIFLIGMMVLLAKYTDIAVTITWIVLAAVVAGLFFTKQLKAARAKSKGWLIALGNGVVLIIKIILMIVVGVSFFGLVKSADRYGMFVALAVTAGFMALLFLVFFAKILRSSTGWKKNIVLTVVGATMVLMALQSMPSLVSELAGNKGYSFSTDAYLAEVAANQPGSGTLKYTERIDIKNDCIPGSNRKNVEIDKRDGTCYVKLRISNGSVRVYSPHARGFTLEENEWVVIMIDPKSAKNMQLTAFRFVYGDKDREQSIPAEFNTLWLFLPSTRAPN